MNPTVEESQVLLETPYFAVRRDRVRWPNGFTHEFYFMDPGSSYVVVIAIRDDAFLLVSQYRHTAEERSLEFPMGVAEKGESFEDAARRELHEETGVHAGQLIELGSFYPSIGRQRSRGRVFLAEDLREEGVRQPDRSELDLIVSWMDLADWRNTIRSGGIIAGDSLSAWALYCAWKEGL